MYCFFMTGLTVPEDHRLDQGGPAQVVHVVERCSASDQLADNAVVAEMGCSNQGRAVVDAGDQPGAGTGGEQGLQRWHVISDSCNSHSVIALIVEKAWIRSGSNQGLNHGTMALECRHMQRCAAVAVAGI